MNEQQLAAVKQALEFVKANHSGGPDAFELITTLQSIISQHALDKKAENARELGLSYEPAPVTPKPWVGLTKDDVESWDLPVNPTVFEFVQFIEAKIKAKNT